MSNPDYLLCDICKKQIPKDARIFLSTGREMDGAGDIETVGFTTDLCAKCWASMVGEFNSYEFANFLRKRLKC